MADNEVIIELKAKIDSIDKSLKRIEDKSEKTGDKVDKELGDGLGKKIGTGFKVGAAAAVAALASVAFAAVKLRQAAVEASARQEDAVNQLNQSLIAAGTFSEEATRSLQDYASELQRTTTLGDEAVLEQLALARTFARSNEEARDLVDAAIELSAATGTELRSAVVNLGKSFSGLTGELGESVGEIRTLTAEELKAGAAIDLIKGKFDGFAAAQTNTYSGAVSQLKNTYGDLLESIGDLITQSPSAVASIKFVRESIERASIAVKEFAGSGGLGALTSTVFDVTKFLTIVLGGAIEGVINTFQAAGKVIGGFAAALVAIFSGEFSQAGEIIKSTLSETFSAETFNTNGTEAALGFINGLQTAIETAKPITRQKGQETGAELGAGIEQGLLLSSGGVGTILDGVNAKLFATKDTFKAFTQEIKQSSAALVGTLKTTVATGIGGAFQSIGQALVQGQNVFAAFGKAILGLFGDIAIQLGQFYLTLGLANLFLNPAAAAGQLAGGAALLLLGGALKALAGGGGGQATAGASAPSSAGANIGDANVIADPALTQLQETEEREPGTVVNVNVEGNVLDRRETGIELVKVINEQFQTAGGVITRRATV